jgi:antitoxin MazE6
MSKRSRRTVRTAISLPDHLLKEAEAVAQNLGLSRSKLIQMALESFLQKRRDKAVRGQIERYVAEQGGLSEEDEILLEHAQQMIRKVE